MHKTSPLIHAENDGKEVCVFNEETLKNPYVPKEIVEYLETAFGIDYLMTAVKAANNDERLGIIKGAREVICRLKHLSEDGEA